MSVPNDCVSEWAFCCAHCGHIEPSNMAEMEADESCTIGAVYVHNDDCRARECGVEHDMFMALWNARTHMEMNGVLLSRANESLCDAMTPYINRRLTDSSFFVIKNQCDQFWRVNYE